MASSGRSSCGGGRAGRRGDAGKFRAGSFSGAARSLVYHDRRAGVARWVVNTVADALVILARAALSLILALALVALAIYAAGARIGEWVDRTPRETNRGPL